MFQNLFPNVKHKILAPFLLLVIDLCFIVQSIFIPLTCDLKTFYFSRDKTSIAVLKDFPLVFSFLVA